MQKILNIIRSYKGKVKEKKTLKSQFKIYIDKSLLFIHIPKAAGVSIHKSLYNTDSPGHLTALYYKSHFSPKKWNSLYKFTFVRDPYTRLYSAYNYLRKGGRGRFIDIKYQRYLAQFDSFEDFVINGLHEAIEKNMQHFKPQYSMLIDESGRLLVDYVGKFETINDDFKKVQTLAKLKKVVELEHFNSSKNAKDELINNFSENMYPIINHFYKEDFEIFHYSKKS